MACKNCKINPVWKFTNKIQLCKNCFCDYFERKVFATIRKFNLMSKDRVFLIKKDNYLKTNVLIYVLKSKFQVRFSNKPNINSDNLSKVAEEIFSKILKGEFSKKNKKIISPLYYLSDREIEVYAKIRGLKGKAREENKKTRNLFKRFTSKNQDLEHNVINAFCQLR